MEASDYYCPETVTSTVAYNVGRSVRAIQVKTVEAISPLKASVAVAAVWGTVAALMNARKYRQGKMAKRDAILDTVGESAGMGLASALGLLASNAARTALVATSASSLIPFTVGVVATAGAKVAWNCTTQRHLTCEGGPAS
jgi:hypothetical protein